MIAQLTLIVDMPSAASYLRALMSDMGHLAVPRRIAVMDPAL